MDDQTDTVAARKPVEAMPPPAHGSSVQPARRFLGGAASSGASATGFPVWFRLLGLGAGSLCAALGLLSALSWPLQERRAEPTVHCLVVPHYAAPAMPPLGFAENDARLVLNVANRLMRSRSTKSVLQKAYDRSDFASFFEHRLNDGAADASIAYVIAQGVSSGGHAYLLPAEAAPQHPETGYPLRDMLEAFAHGNSKNKLLLLDVVRIDQDLRMGLIGNDFVHDLQREFAELTHRLANDPNFRRQNLRILCSCDDGQKAWSSPELKVSPFALAACYCLAGGAVADQIDGATGSADRKISTKELIEYVSHSVANWSLEYRNAPQTPVELEHGSDFPLATVDASVTIPGILADLARTRTPVLQSEKTETPPKSESNSKNEPTEPSPSATAKTAEGHEPVKESPDETAVVPAEAAGAAFAKRSEGSVTAIDDTQTLLAEISRHWEWIRTFRSSSQFPRRPLLLSRAQQLLIRAERYLLSGALPKARQIVDQELPSLARQFESSGEETVWDFPWTLASIDSASKDDPLRKEQALVDKALADPSDENLKALGNLTTVEANTLRAVSDASRSGGKWLDPELMKLAVATRTLAQRNLRQRHSEVLDLVKAKLEMGDHHRLQAERDLMLGRLDSARQAFQAAANEYQNTLAEAALSAQLLNTAQQLAVAVPNLIVCLGANPDGTDFESRNIALLQRFLRQMKEFCEKPTSFTLRQLAAAAVDLERWGRQYAEEGLRSNNWRQCESALEIPFLSPAARQQLLLSLLKARNAAHIEPGFRAFMARPQGRLANPFPVAEFFSLTWGTDEMLTGREAALARWRRFDPSARPTPISLSMLVRDESLRQERAMAAADLRSWLTHLRTEKASLGDMRPWWSKRMRLLLTASLIADGPMESSAKDEASEELWRQSELAYLNWEATRLHYANSCLPDDSCGAALKSLAIDIRNYDPEYRVPISSPGFRLIADGPVQRLADRYATASFTLNPLRDLGRTVRADLIVERPPDDACLMLVLDGLHATNGRLVRPLDQVVAEHGHHFTLGIRANVAHGLDSAHHVTARVEYADGRIDWLPANFAVPMPKVKPATLVINGHGAGQERDRVRLYPNQSMALPIGVQKHTSEAVNLRVELEGADSAQSIPLELKPEQTGVVQVVPVADFTIPLDVDTLTVRLLQGDELLDEHHLAVTMLDLQQCFRQQIEYDPQRRKVSARFRCVHASDVRASVPFRLELPDRPASQGALARSFDPISSDLTLEAQLPAGGEEEFRVVVSASDVPRVFRSTAGLQHLLGEVDPQLRLSVRSLLAERGCALAEGDLRLSLGVQLDGPDEVRCEAGIDANHNDVLDTGEIQFGGQFPFGRESRLECVASTKPPEIRLVTKMSDLSIPIDLTGCVGAQTVIVRAIAGNQSIQQRLDTYLLRDAPAVRILSPAESERVPKGKPLAIAIQTDRDNFPAIDRIELGFDLNQNGLLEPGEALVPIGWPNGQPVRFRDSHFLSLQLPTEKVVASRAVLLLRTIVQAADLHGAGPAKTLVGPFSRREIEFESLGKIVGKVIAADGAPQRGAVVSIAGIGRTSCDPNGIFSFENVRPGKYTVTAATLQRIGRNQATVLPGQVTSVELNVKLK